MSADKSQQIVLAARPRGYGDYSDALLYPQKTFEPAGRTQQDPTPSEKKGLSKVSP
jgi:hypothetical protein